MGSLSEGEHWLKMRYWPIKQLVPVASSQDFGRGEEMARSLLRNKVVARRVRQTKGNAPHHVFHDLATCACGPCRDLRKVKRA